MQKYQEEFIAFAIEQGVLQFGEFVLKSGRVSPWFFNSGLFNTGYALARLGHYYSEAVVSKAIEFDILFGPAYKGIPLVAATAVALANDHDRDVPYVFNRKEAKDHGEGGNLVGAPLEGNALIIDDVITAGTAIRQAASIIRTSKAVLIGVVIAVDREERGKDDVSAIREVEQNYGIKVTSIVKCSHIIEYLETHNTAPEILEKMKRYNDQYGISRRVD
ncbi:MAG: orotate phosphoribosyltransferase [Gammaproteobacteria bacterium]|nr:orotate phosphoribosyltransferase [Gammaproteobacteria bacterium]